MPSDSQAEIASPANRLPLRKPGACWLLTLLIGGGALFVWEAYWRSMGHGPMVVDSLSLWSQQRHRIKGNSPDEFVLLGTSRIRFGFSSEAFRKRYPDRKLVRLGIVGRRPVAALRDLADQESFNGIVLCEINGMSFDRRFHDDQYPWVKYSKRTSLIEPFETWLSAQLQNQIAMLKPGLRLDRTIYRRWTGERDPMPYLTVKPDRSVLADYSLRTDVEEMGTQRIEGTTRFYLDWPLPSSDEWLTQAKVADDAVRKIQQRGGHVIFVRFPTTGPLWTLDERFMPRAEYWDVMAKQSSAPTIHFRDVPGLARFVCPDHSHLDRKDIDAFTNVLLDEVEHALAEQTTKLK